MNSSGCFPRNTRLVPCPTGGIGIASMINMSIHLQVFIDYTFGAFYKTVRLEICKNITLV